MTYKHLTKFIKENIYESNFDLTALAVKSKIIFAIGGGASNVCAMLSSIMYECEIPHSRYINIDYFDLRDRFLNNNDSVSLDKICKNAEKIKKMANSIISGDDLLFCLSLSLLDGEYILIEMSEEYYKSLISRINFSPFAILLCSLDDKKNEELIKITPNTTHVCALSQKENYDYIRPIDKNGRKTALVSKNKYLVKSTNLLFADFYHFSYLYRLPCIDSNNIFLATLAIESATLLFSAPRPYIYKGLSNAMLPCELKLISISPIILLKIGDDNFKLPKGLSCDKITEVIPSQKPTQNTIFYGNKEYIDKIKKAMEK